MSAIGVLRVETMRTARQPSTLVYVGILVGYVLLLAFAFSSILRSPGAGGASGAQLVAQLRKDAVALFVEVASSIGTILVVVFAAQGIGQEFSRATLRTLLVSGASRDDVVVGKTAFLALATLPVALLIVLASIAGVGVLGLVTGEPLLHADGGDLAILALRTWAGLALWALVTFGTTLSVGSVGAGMGLSLSALIVGDVVRSLLASLGTVGLWATRALPNTAINTIAGAQGIAPDAWAWIVPNLLVYVVALNAYAAWKLARMDVIAATK